MLDVSGLELLVEVSQEQDPGGRVGVDGLLLMGNEATGAEESHCVEVGYWRGSSSTSRVGIDRRDRRMVGGGQVRSPRVSGVERGGERMGVVGVNLERMDHELLEGHRHGHWRRHGGKAKGVLLRCRRWRTVQQQ